MSATAVRTVSSQLAARRVALSLFPALQASPELQKFTQRPTSKPKSETAQSASKTAVQAHHAPAPRKPTKSFTLHIGASLQVPTKDAFSKPAYDEAAVVSATAPAASEHAVRDPFEGLPFRALADKLGELMMPGLQAMREQQRAAARESREAAAAAEVVVPQVPHFLPFTRWAASNERIRATFVDDKSTRKRARLSWYHPDDTMVPRDWFRGGLLADLKYYNPFGKAE